MSAATSNKALEYVLVLVISISALAINVTLPSIPLANEQLGGGVKDGHFIVISYLWGYALGHIPFGMFADHYGRRPVLLLGLAIFTIAGLVSCLTTDKDVMFAARFFQGIGGAVGPVLARAIARDIGVGQHLSRLMAMLMNALAFVPLLAPLLGAMLVAIGGWRAPFIFSFALGIIAIFAVIFYVPETGRARDQRPDNMKRFADNWRGFSRSRDSLWGMGLIVSAFCGYLAMVSSIASIFHDVYMLSATAIGLLAGLLLVPYAASATVNRYIVRSRSPRNMLAISLYFYSGAAVLMAGLLLLGHAPLWAFCIAIMIYLVGLGISFSNATVVALSGQAKAAGFAAGIVGTLQIGAGAIGSHFSALFYGQTTASLLLVMLASCIIFFAIYMWGSKPEQGEAIA